MPDAKALMHLFTAQGLPLLLLAIVSFVTARLLGPSGRGLTALALAVAALGSAACFMSLHVGVVQACATFGAKRAIWRGITVSMGAGFVVTALCVASRVAWVGPAATARQRLLFLACIAIAIQAPGLVVVRTLQGLGESRRYRRAVVSRVVLFTGLVGIGCIKRLTPSEVLIALLAADALQLGYGYLLLRQTLPKYLAQRKQEQVAVVRASIGPHLASISQQFLYRSDLLILGFIAPYADTGYYAVATTLAETLWVSSEAISLWLYSEATDSRGRNARMGRFPKALLSKGTRLNSVTSALGAAGLAALGYPAIHLLLPKYGPSYVLLLLLLPGVAVGGSIRLLTSYATANQDQRFLNYSAFVSAILTPIYIPLILAMRSIGAAIGSDVIYVLAAVLLWRRHRVALAGSLQVVDSV